FRARSGDKRLGTLRCGGGGCAPKHPNEALLNLCGREETPGGGHDCWIAATLTAAVAGGFTAFPLGIYTDAEREALERIQTVYPPDTGGNLIAADQACQTRYGLDRKSTRLN